MLDFFHPAVEGRPVLIKMRTQPGSVSLDVVLWCIPMKTWSAPSHFLVSLVVQLDICTFIWFWVQTAVDLMY